MPHGRLPEVVLADVLARLSVALGAGVDVRRAMASEAARVPARWRPVFATVAEGVAAGEPLGAALARAGDAVPPAVAGMVAVGDRTGRDAETLAAVAEALRDAVAARRRLRTALAAPALRLAVAVAVIGLLILVTGGMSDLAGQPLDLLGLGLRGPRGLAVFAACLAAALAVAAVAVPAAARSWRRRGVVRSIGERLPVLGPAARAAEAARWCRAASLAAGAGIDAGGVVALASQAAPGLALDAAAVTGRLRGGDSLEEALAAGGTLPRDVLDAVACGEASGTVAESLARLVPGLEDRARSGFAAAAGAVGFAVWAAVIGLVMLVAMRLMGVYLGIIDQAARPL